MINVSNRVYEISALLNAEEEEVPAMTVRNLTAEISELIYNAKNGEDVE